MIHMDYSRDYTLFFEELQQNCPDGVDVHSDAVGGDYEEMGFLMHQLLIHIGLMPYHKLVDVGCGTGRLAYQLSKNKHENYVGYDVVEDFLKFAKYKCTNRQYQFLKIDNENIPLPVNSVDYVCFFLCLLICGMNIRINI